MKLRIAAMVVVAVSLGIAAWALYEKRDTERVMLSMLYLDSTTHIRNDLYVLSRLREGKTQDAITYLERLLEMKVAVLEGCKVDLCAQATPTTYGEALQAAATYKTQYQAR